MCILTLKSSQKSPVFGVKLATAESSGGSSEWKKKRKVLPFVLQYEIRKKVLQYRQQYQIMKSIGNMEAIGPTQKSIANNI